MRTIHQKFQQRRITLIIESIYFLPKVEYIPSPQACYNWKEQICSLT